MNIFIMLHIFLSSDRMQKKIWESYIIDNSLSQLVHLALFCLVNFFPLLLKHVFIYLKGRATEGGGERQRGSICSLATSSNGQGQNRASPKPAARSSYWVSHRVQEPKHLALFCAFTGTSAGRIFCPWVLYHKQREEKEQRVHDVINTLTKDSQILIDIS